MVLENLKLELHGGGRYEFFFSDLQLYCKQKPNVKDRFSRLLIRDRGFNSTNLSRLYNAVGTLQPQLAFRLLAVVFSMKQMPLFEKIFSFFTHAK